MELDEAKIHTGAPTDALSASSHTCRSAGKTLSPIPDASPSTSRHMSVSGGNRGEAGKKSWTSAGHNSSSSSFSTASHSVTKPTPPPRLHLLGHQRPHRFVNPASTQPTSHAFNSTVRGEIYCGETLTTSSRAITEPLSPFFSLHPQNSAKPTTCIPSPSLFPIISIPMSPLPSMYLRGMNHDLPSRPDRSTNHVYQILRCQLPPANTSQLCVCVLRVFPHLVTRLGAPTSPSDPPGFYFLLRTHAPRKPTCLSPPRKRHCATNQPGDLSVHGVPARGWMGFSALQPPLSTPHVLLEPRFL